MGETVTLIIQSVSLMLSQWIKNRPVNVTLPTRQPVTPAVPPATYSVAEDRTVTKLPSTAESALSFKGQDETNYRFECCSKHLSTAAGIFKEAYDRAISNGMDKGVIEKVREGMMQVNAMESDISVMMGTPDISQEVKFLDDGQRMFRKSIWAAKLETTGTGDKDEDIGNLAASHQWLKTMLGATYDMSEKHRGTSCQKVI